MSKILNEFWNVFFFSFLVFEKMSFSFPMVLVMLFVHVGKRSNSHSNNVQRCSSKQVFSNISQNSQEITCVGVSF